MFRASKGRLRGSAPRQLGSDAGIAAVPPFGHAVRVVVFAPHFPPAFRAGGPLKSISQMVNAAGPQFELFVVTRNWDLGCREPLRNRSNEWDGVGTRVLAFDRNTRSYINALVQTVRVGPQLLYLNSLFDPLTGVVPSLIWLILRLRGTKLLVAPRGQLARPALSKSPLRKRVLMALWWVWVLRKNDAAVHAASESERAAVFEHVGIARTIVRANSVGEFARLPVEGGSSDGALRAIFLGRIVPNKGLLDLLIALRGCHGPVILDVYGPGEDADYLALCRAAAEELAGSVRVSFLGAVPSERVRSILSAYDVMLNPTLGESFGQAIAESLSVGTPVAVAAVTPWTPWIEVSGGGRIVRETDGWAELVKDFVSLDSSSMRALRRNARSAFEAWWDSSEGQPHLFEMACEEFGLVGGH